LTVLVRDRESTTVDHRRPSFTIEWFVGAIGTLATAIGLWMFHGPADGVLQIWGWKWDIADLSQGWALSAIIAGAVVVAAVLARVSRRLSLEGSPTGADVASGAALISVLLALVYAIVWIF
jgi:hypothetical protein